jgi:hypothetical protein
MMYHIEGGVLKIAPVVQLVNITWQTSKVKRVMTPQNHS